MCYAEFGEEAEDVEKSNNSVYFKDINSMAATYLFIQ